MTNEELITVNIDGANAVFIAANVADPIDVESRASVAFGKPTPLAQMASVYHRVQTEGNVASVTSHVIIIAVWRVGLKRNSLITRRKMLVNDSRILLRLAGNSLADFDRIPAMCHFISHRLNGLFSPV